MTHLLDTVAISQLVSPRAEPRVIEFIASSDESDFAISVMTVAELRKGIERLPRSARRAALQDWLEHDLMRRFGPRLLPVDTVVANRWGRLVSERERRGRPLPIMDSLIAATALVHGLKLVTRNVADFEETGVEIVNPWA